MSFLRVAAWLFVFAAIPGFSSDCLSYAPAVVTLQGKLVRRTFPEPIREGNLILISETPLLLDVESAICMNEDKSDASGFNRARKGIHEIQLFVKLDAYKQYSALVGKKVTVTGTLFGEHNAHHHTPVLLTVTSLK